MISKPTVFILGAGASAHYGFPSGEELVSLICEELKPKINHYEVMGEHNEVVDNDSLHAVLLENNFSKEEIREFRKALKKSQLYSIDSFLEVNPKFIKIGKISILHVLLRFEKKSIDLENHNWYKIIWNKIYTKNFKNLGENNLSIITYNYDRSLEYYLVNAMMNLYNKPLTECLKVFENDIPIIHIHGTFGETVDNNLEFIHYGRTDFHPQQYGLNSKSIKIVYEKIDDDPVFIRVHKLLQSLDETGQITFLGFGYNSTNLSRLNLSDTRAHITGTCKGKTGNEVREMILENSTSRLTIDSNARNMDCETFIREKTIFF